MGRLQTSAIRTLERLRAGPGLGLTRVPGVRQVHRLVESVAEKATRRLGRGPVETNAYGFRFRVNPDDRQVSLELLLHGTYEPEETSLFEAAIEPGMVVVDAGANLGVYSLIAARKTGPAGHVISCEPDPASFELLNQNVRANGFENVTTLRVGLGASPGSMSLFRVPGHAALASLSRANARDSSLHVDVEIVTLDDMLAERGLDRIDVLKVDTQGAEVEVLTGAAETIRRCRPTMFVEYWPAGLAGMGHDVADLLGLFERWDYEIFDVQDPGRPLRGSALQAENTAGLDLMLRPRRSGSDPGSRRA